MVSLLTIFTLVFTVMFSSTSFAEWTKVEENNAHYGSKPSLVLARLTFAK